MNQACPSVFLEYPVYPLLPFTMKEFANGGRTPEEQFSGYCYSSARMVIECAFGRLKAQFGCCEGTWILTSTNYHVIHSCFVLHNFCEINKEVTHISRNTSRTTAKSEIEAFTIIVNSWKPLIFDKKTPILAVAAVLGTPLIMPQLHFYTHWNVKFSDDFKRYRMEHWQGIN